MGLKKKQAQLRQKEYWERRLEDRLSFLSGKGIDAAGIDKDPMVRKLKADIRAVNRRLKAITAGEKRTQELAKIKADRAAAPKEQAGGKTEKPQKARAEGKEKKAKGEKKPASPKAKEGAKSQKGPEASKPVSE